MMKLKSVVMLGTVISVLLFAMAVGLYVFTRLDMTAYNRDINLYSLVPSDCSGVLESDNINDFLDNSQMQNYNHELRGFQFPGLFEFLLGELNKYSAENAHGLSSQMSRLVVSFHHSSTPIDQVVYFRMGTADEHVLADMLQEYAPGNFLPKEEEYRGKSIYVYPLSNEEFLAAYTEKGVFVVSYQKRLIEKVIDARLDNTSLNDDEVFSKLVSKKKEQNFLTLYAREAPMPFLNMGSDCWSEYNFYMNSDVVYLTGDTFVPVNSRYIEDAGKRFQEVEIIKEDSLLISSDKDSTALYMEQAQELDEMKSYALFDECVANLSHDALFSLVADMQKVVDAPQMFQPYLPPFIINNAPLFRSFILSAQLSLNADRSSHIWVFTYKY